jgi:subtilisin family serine protease
VTAAQASGRPSVISMSLGGAPSRAIDRAVSAAVAAGVHVVVAAGNENQNAAVSLPLGCAYPFTNSISLFRTLAQREFPRLLLLEQVILTIPGHSSLTLGKITLIFKLSSVVLNLRSVQTWIYLHRVFPSPL